MIGLNRAVPRFFEQVDPRLATAAWAGSGAAREGLIHGVSLINAEATGERDPDSAPTFQWDPDLEQSVWLPSGRDADATLRIITEGGLGYMPNEEVDAIPGLGAFVDRGRGFKPIERFAAEIAVDAYLSNFANS
jgi:hypothetical protein